MAKKHKTKRRRVGGLSLNPNSPVVKIGVTALGFFAGDGINSLIDKANLKTTAATATAPATAEPRIGKTPLLIAQGGIGTALLLLKGKKSTGIVPMIKTGVGGLLAGAALRRAAKDFGIMGGYQNTPVIGKRMGGYQSVPVVGRMPTQLSGTPSALTGYRVNGYRPNGSGMSVMGSVNGGGGLSNDGSGYMS